MWCSANARNRAYAVDESICACTVICMFGYVFGIVMCTRYSCQQLISVLPYIFNYNIAPHIDSIKFSGDMIASLSLASSRIMRLKLDPEFAHLYPPDAPPVPTTIEFIVPPRSLYILSGPMRYHYTHEILGTNQTALTTLTTDTVTATDTNTSTGERRVSSFGTGKGIGRRLSIMHRDEKVG